jgi:hypothetical protein
MVRGGGALLCVPLGFFFSVVGRFYYVRFRTRVRVGADCRPTGRYMGARLVLRIGPGRAGPGRPKPIVLRAKRVRAKKV